MMSLTQLEISELDVDEIIGTLSCREIEAAVPSGTFRWTDRRRKLLMKKAIMRFSDELKSMIY